MGPLWFVRHILFVIISLTWITVLSQKVDDCISGCACSNTRGKSKDPDNLPGRRVVCRGTDVQLTSIKEIPLHSLPVDTLQLDLSGNAITYIPSNTLDGLSSLQKLDLSENQISRIETRAFRGLTSLQRLDLSSNKISVLSNTTFEGLAMLERLSLSGNPLKTVPDGTFEPLIALKKVDFQSDSLICDCHMEWIVRWLRKRRDAQKDVRIVQTTCAAPEPLKGTDVRTLKKKDLHCEWPVDLPMFKLIPSTNQVVFQGDKLPFECRATVIEPTMTMLWVRKENIVKSNRSEGIYVHQHYTPDRSVIVNSLVLEKLEIHHTGIWKCLVQTSRGNDSKSVSVVVVSKDMRYCSSLVTRTNKGRFAWPKTVSGVTMNLPCPAGASTSYTGSGTAQAAYRCNSDGQWESLDTSQCQYHREVTRILEQYANMDIGNMTKLASRADLLKEYLSNARTLTDKMDIIFISKIVEGLSHYVKNNEKLSKTILTIVSTVMTANEKLLGMAQRTDKACTRMVRAVEELPRQLLMDDRKMATQYSDNIALQAFEVQPSGFPGITCVATSGDQIRYEKDSFTCSFQSNYTADDLAVSMDVEGMIYIPGSVFNNVICQYPYCTANKGFKLQFVVYKNAKLFPTLEKEDDDQEKDEKEDTEEEKYNLNEDEEEDEADRRVATSVISAQIAGVTADNLTEPVVINLVSQFTGINPSPVYWDFLAQDGLGAWQTEGCQLMEQDGNLSTIQCSHMTNFALLQSSPLDPGPGPLWLGRVFGMSPAVYAGSGMLVLCLMAVIITYATSPRYLKMSGKAKHSIANMCVALLLLCLTFTLGVRMTAHEMACKVVGMAIHYFSLCTVFWILITAYNLYKKFLKAERPVAPPVDSLDGPLPPKPMLRFYLVGWGIGLIICGITAAVSLEYYTGGKPYCFLSLEPSVGAFFVPLAILTFLNCVFFMCICRVIRGSTTGNLIDEPETEEINEIELTSPEMESINRNNNATPTLTPGSSVMDLEFRPISQLRALAGLLFLYMVTWACAAFAVALPFPSVIPHQDIIFNYLYGFSAAGLGIFILMFFCLGRDDARMMWRKFFTCEQQPSYNMTVSDSNHSAHCAPIGGANGHAIQPASSLDSSFTNKSTNINRAQHMKKQSNINLVPSQTATLTDASISSIQENVPSFFNPRQNGVARKYWDKKQAKHGGLLRNKDINIDSQSGQSSHDGRIRDPNKRLSQGTSSDNNTHLSIEIQIQSRPRSGAYSPKGISAIEPPPNYHSLGRGSNRPVQYSPLTVQTTQPLLSLAQLERNQISPVGGHSSHQGHYKSGLPGGTFHNSPLPMLPVSSQVGIPSGHVQYPALPPPPPGTGQPLPPPLIPPPHGPSNTLPRPTRTPVNEFMQRNGSVPRLRDFDGQSQVSQEPHRPQSVNSELHTLERYRPPEPPVAQPPAKARHLVGDTDSQSADPNKSQDSNTDLDELPTQTQPADSSTGTGSGSRRKKKRESFIDQLEQRIPHNKISLSPSVSRTDNTKSDPDSQAQNDSGGQCRGDSDSPCQREHGRERRRTRSHDSSSSHKRHHKRHSRSLPKCKKDWNSEVGEKPNRPAYAYVNHNYQEKVLQKLIQTHNNGLVDPIARGLSWLPRSVSAYEQVANEVLDNIEDTSSSSSDDSTDDIWVLQKKKKKFKKETSV